MTTQLRTRRIVNAASAFSLAIGLVWIAAAGAVDYVILKDGTILQGRLFKEKANVSDSLGKMMVQVDKSNGLQGIDDGPKSIFFGSIGAQVGESGNDPNFRPEFKRFERFIPATGTLTLPGNLQLSTLDFDAEWKTQFKVNTGDGNWQIIKLHVTSLAPNMVFMTSSSHRWRLVYDPKELGPVYVRKLLATHPELIEKLGIGEPNKRVMIAQFMKDVGWLDAARQELEKAKTDIPGAWPADATERVDKLHAAIDRATAKQFVEEANKAVASGRYAVAKRAIETFKPEHADPKDVTRAAIIKAAYDGVTPRFEAARTLLLPLAAAANGGNTTAQMIAAGGGMVAPFVPQPRLSAAQQALSDAGEAVLAELHPDSAERLDLFISLAEQAAKAKKAGEKPAQSDEQLLALAVTGWLKGKNGAAADVAIATRCWNARVMLLKYQREGLMNERAKLVGNYVGTSSTVPFDELAQIISLLPPPFAIDVEKPGLPTTVPGVYQRNTGSVTDRAAGVDYAIHLPPEYQPGRAYPLLIALGPANAPPAELVARLAYEGDRNGYVVVAPNWAHKMGKTGLYDFSGDAHSVVSDTLRDLFRRVNVDPDRVMLVGLADGATLALDVATGHPDLFAAVAPFGAYPRQDVFMEYWSNLQKVPVYAVTGELSSEGLKLTYNMFQKMLKAGFPSLLTVYKGRAIELYAAEIEPMFEWFNKRVRPATSTVVKPLKGQSFNWLSMRKTDNRFYWISLDKITEGNLMNGKKAAYPAGINTDIQTGNLVKVSTRGVKSFTVLFERDMIDWTKPLYVQVNGNTPPGYKPKVLQPDLNVLLEEFLASGDRKRIFLQRLTFTGF